MVKALALIGHNIVVAAFLHHFAMARGHVAVPATVGFIEKSDCFYLAAAGVYANTEAAG
jgi:hypothetical protein